MNGGPLISFFLALIPMVSWGIMDFISGALSRSTKAIVILFGVQFVGLILLALLFPFYGGQAKNWLWLILLGILPLFAWLLYLKAAQVGVVSIASPISRANFVFASILGILFLREGISFLKIVSVLAVFAGGILLSKKRNEAPASKNIFTIFTAGALFAVLSAISSGLLLFFLATFSRTNGWYDTAFFLRIGVTSFAFLGLIPNKNFKNLLTKIPWLLISIAALADVIGLSAYNIAVSHYAVSYVSVMASCASLVTVLLARLYLKERLTAFQYGGTLLMVFGIIALQIR